MIPVLFTKGSNVFTSNGQGRLTDTTSCIVHEQRNGQFELELEMPISGLHFSEIGLGSIITAKPSPTRAAQPFEVYSIEKTMDGMMATIRAQHISYRLSLIPVLPFTASSANDALQGLKSHAVETCPFTFYTDVTRAGTYTQTEPASLRNRLAGEQGSVLQVYQGEYLFDGFDVSLLAARGIDRGTEIRYGKNLQSLEQDQSIEDTITGIVPYWVGKDGEQESVYWLPEVVLYSPNATSFPYKRTVVVDMSGDFDEKPTETELRLAGEKYIVDNNIGVPKVSFELTAETLAQALNYTGTALSERIDLCDIVTIIFPAFGISAKAKVIETVFDVLTERFVSFKIGDERFTLADTIASTTEQIKQSEANQQTFMTQALAQATALINGDLTGASVVTQTDANGNPVGIIFMDTTDPDTAVNCIRINANGIGFSQNGISGPYSSAWTIDGTLDMSQINVININASNITAGIIRDRTGQNFWNLETGEMQIQASVDIDIGGRNYIRESNTLSFESDSFAWMFMYNGTQATVNGNNLEVKYYG